VGGGPGRKRVFSVESLKNEWLEKEIAVITGLFFANIIILINRIAGN
jgi:hypothetical protein